MPQPIPHPSAFFDTLVHALSAQWGTDYVTAFNKTLHPGGDTQKNLVAKNPLVWGRLRDPMDWLDAHPENGFHLSIGKSRRVTNDWDDQKRCKITIGALSDRPLFEVFRQCAGFHTDRGHEQSFYLFDDLNARTASDSAKKQSEQNSEYVRIFEAVSQLTGIETPALTPNMPQKDSEFATVLSVG